MSGSDITQGSVFQAQFCNHSRNGGRKLSALFFFPLNVIGKIAEVLSISFRLFGNIKGGVIIVISIGGIYGGVFTPVEAAAVGAMLSMFFAILRRKFPPEVMADDVARVLGK